MALYASEKTSYNQVVQVLDFLREVGGERVALATLAGESLQTTNEPTAPQPPGTSVPGFNPYQPPGTSVPGITPPTSGTNPGLEDIPVNPGEGIPTSPNQQQQGLPNFNGSSPGNPQQSLPGETGVSPNPSPTTSPRESNAAPEN
jgi:biopolymer transport protein ExbD